LSVPAVSVPPVLDAEPRPLPLAAKLLYGVGEMPITVLMFLSGFFLLFFYKSVMGVPPALAGLGLSASLVLDAVLDPYIGHLSDRTRHRIGRRHVFMLPGALAMGVCFFLLFSPPQGLSLPLLFAWLLGCSIAVRFTSAIYRIPYLGLGAELSRGYDDRTSTMAVRALFGLLGTLAAAGLSFLLFFPNAADKLHYTGYPRLGLAFGTLMTVSGLFSTLGTWNRRSSAPVENTHASAPHFFSGFRISMGNAAFRKIWLASVIFFLAVTLNFSMAIDYFTWYAKIATGGILSSIQLCFCIGALIGVFLWMLLARYTEKRTLYLAAIAATAVVMVCATVLVGPGKLFGTGHPLPLMFGHVLAGIFASAYWVLPSSMVADVTDSDELSTGLRREGIYYGIMNFGEKIAAGGALFLAGLLLTVFRKLSHGAAYGTPGHAPAAIPYVGMLFGAVPAVLVLISLISLLSYRLDRRAVHGIQQQLAARAPRSEGD
jgi:glycoside/pentoside/hexuronide:cation symporter, GPH family